MNVKRSVALKKTIHVVVFLICLCYVLFQTYLCIEKYQQKTQVTQVFVDSADKHLRPDITICLIGHEEQMPPDYTKWFSKVDLRFFDDSQTLTIFANETENWKTFEKSMQYGRTDKIQSCVTFAPIKKFGSFANMRFYLKEHNFTGNVYFHSPEMIKMKAMKQLKKTPLKPKSLYLTYNVLKLVDYQGQGCTSELEYVYDTCKMQETRNVSLAEIGCTTRFDSMQDHICENKEDVQKAFEIYWSGHNETIGNCLHPCIYVLVTGFNIDFEAPASSKNMLKINFDQMVKVFQAKYDYSFESMIAEIGGYVGLFLGVSVYQLTGFVDYIFSKLSYLQ